MEFRGAAVRGGRSLLWGAAALVSAALVMVVLLVQLVQGDEDRQTRKDLVTGAQGTFPAPLGTAAPAAPDHVLRRTTADETVAHGLSVRQTARGVRAVNVRTGKQYWRYERRDTDVAVRSYEVSDRTVVTGFDDGRLTGIDLRTGRPLWTTEVRGSAGLVERTEGKVLTSRSGTVYALSERTGRILWRTKAAPRPCTKAELQAAYAFPDRLTAVLLHCNWVSGNQYNVLLGLDDRTGRVLWRQRSVYNDSPLRGDQHTLLAPDPDPLTPQTVRLLEVSRAGATVRGGFPVKRDYALVAGDGVAVSNLDPEIYDTDSNTLLTTRTTDDGHVLWRLRAPTGQAYGEPAIADGRVYVVRQPVLRYADAGHRTEADLLVLDARTGRLRHTVRLPDLTVPNDVNAYAVLDTRDSTDGAIGVAWRGERTELLLAVD